MIMVQKSSGGQTQTRVALTASVTVSASALTFSSNSFQRQWYWVKRRWKHFHSGITHGTISSALFSPPIGLPGWINTLQKCWILAKIIICPQYLQLSFSEAGGKQASDVLLFIGKDGESETRCVHVVCLLSVVCLNYSHEGDKVRWLRTECGVEVKMFIVAYRRTNCPASSQRLQVSFYALLSGVLWKKKKKNHIICELCY